MIDLFFVFFLFFVTPEGFTTVVANEGLEKARDLMSWRVTAYQLH